MNRVFAVLLVFVASSCGPGVPAASPTSRPSEAKVVASPTAARVVQPDIKLLVSAWDFRDSMVLVAAADGKLVTIVAVPLGSGAPTEIVRLPSVGTAAWSLRDDGSALVVSLATSDTTSRLAVIDLARAQVRWLTPDLHLNETTPIWISGGKQVAFGRNDEHGDLGVFAVEADGSGLTSLRSPSRSGSLSTLTRMTADGLLIGADQFNGPHPWVLDPKTSHESSLSLCCGKVQAWRSARPRALVGVTTQTTAPVQGYLALWDDIDGRVVRLTDLSTGQADFDPSGTKVVFAEANATSSSPLAVVDLATGDHAILTGTDGAQAPLWTEPGILFVLPNPQGFTLKLSAADGATRSLLSSSGSFAGLRIVGTHRGSP